MLAEYLGTGDLCDRWRYTRQGIALLIKRRDFPPPAFRINRGRVPVWRLADIKIYERERPELGDEEAKRRKQVGYFLALLRDPKSGAS